MDGNGILSITLSTCETSAASTFYSILLLHSSKNGLKMYTYGKMMFVLTSKIVK